MDARGIEQGDLIESVEVGNMKKLAFLTANADTVVSF